MARKRTWLAGISGILLLLAAVVFFFDWNLAKPYIARSIADATGRSFAINGDLTVHLSLRPRIIANDVHFGNAAWSKDPLMARIKRAEFSIDLLQLLRGRLAIPELALSEAQVDLEVSKEGAPNWIFGKPDRQRIFPALEALTVDRGSVAFRDPTTNTDMAFEVNTLAAAPGEPETMAELKGKGRYKGMPAKLQVRGGALLALRSADRPYPIKATATVGTTKASIDGTLIDPLRLRSESVNFQLEGSDLALLYPIIGVPIPPTAAYKLAGYLRHVGDLWTFKPIKGTIGKSDVAGDFSVDRGRAPQLITANLVSRNLDIADLGGFVGTDAGSNASDKQPPGGKLLPVEPFSLEKLRAADADVRLKAARITTRKVPLEKLDVHLLVKDGGLKLSPLNVGLAGGQLVAEVAMDGSKSHITTRADITVRGLHLDQALPDAKLNAASTGVMGGRAKLTATGNSVAQMLGAAHGDAALIMEGGTVSELMLRISDLDIANSIALLLGGDKQVPIRCMVANFHAVAGNFTAQELVLDTPKVNITGEGNVNFTDESLHLRLVARSKSFSLALRGPFAVTGTFKNPSVRPEMGNVVVRGGLAVILGALTGGIGALLPLLELGDNRDSNCAALMAQAKSDAGIRAVGSAARR